LENQDDDFGTNMLTAINLFKKTLKYPVLWVSLIYLLWWLLPFTNQTFRDEIIFLIVYFIITILETLLLLSKNKMLTIFLFVVLLCFVLFSCGVTLGLWILYPPSHQRHLIYFPLIIIFSGYKAYDLFRSHLSPGKILPVLLFITTFPVLAGNIAYPISFFPKIVANKEFGDFKYYIIWQYDIDYHSYLSFYKCEKWSFKCDSLPTSQMNFDEIIIDKEKNEVSARGNSGLSYTDGNNPRVYQGYSVQLGNHIYQMAVNARELLICIAHSCDSYTYTLYECDLDYTSCDPLPVQYTETNHEYEWGYLDINEATNEINAYSFKDSLIFTYGENPVCHIHRCEILGQ
jgi:hypothetical protein